MDCRNPIRCQSSDSLDAVVTGAGSCSGIHAVLKTPRYVGAGRGRDEMPQTGEEFKRLCWQHFALTFIMSMNLTEQMDRAQ